MQFNFVVNSNENAVHLWRRLGFRVVGALPAVFDHPRLGPLDAFVMFRETVMQQQAAQRTPRR